MSFDFKLAGGDIPLKNNDIAIVKDYDKLIQDSLKIISTPLGANPLFRWYGCVITKSLVGTAFDVRFTSNIATQQLQAAFDTLMNLQKEQAKTSQLVTPQEQIAAVQGINVQRNVSDPRYYSILANVLSKAFTSVPISTGIQI